MANKAKDSHVEVLHKIYFYDAWRCEPELNKENSLLYLPPAPGMLQNGCYWRPEEIRGECLNGHQSCCDLVGEKHGITVDQRWQHTMEYVDVDDINVIEIGDTRDNDSRQADREQQSVIYLSDGEEEQEDPRDENQTESTARRRRTERNGAS